jgi:hypothetical protein
MTREREEEEEEEEGSCACIYTGRQHWPAAGSALAWLAAGGFGALCYLLHIHIRWAAAEQELLERSCELSSC